MGRPGRAAAGADRVPHPAVFCQRRLFRLAPGARLDRGHRPPSARLCWRGHAPRAGGAGGRPPRTGPARLADAEGRWDGLAVVHRGTAPHPDDVAGQDHELRGAPGLGQAHGAVHLRGGRLHLRAEDRRAGHEPPLRGRPAGPCRHPGRRRGRRGRHGQRGDHRRHPPRVEGRRSRCAARYTCQ